MKNKIILFDLDGTLIDSTEAICESFFKTFNALGYQAPDIEDIKQYIGHTLENMFLFLGISKTNIEESVRVYKQNYQKISKEKTVMLPFAIQAIQEAYQFARLGVVTTKTGSASKVLLDYFDVLKYFDVIVGREDVKFPKPSPEPIFKALESMGQAYESFMIGDTLLDIEAANAANIKPIAVSSGYVAEEVLKQTGVEVFDNVLDAVCFIKNK